MFARRFPRLASAWQRTSSSRPAKLATSAWSNRRPILFGIGVTYFGVGYAAMKRDAYLRDYIEPDTYLVWKLYDGAVVECKGPPSLSALVNAPSSGDDIPRVMELFEAIRALKSAAQDERIRGLLLDLSSLHIPPSVRPEPLGLAQIEELSQAIHEFKLAKHAQFAQPSPDAAALESNDDVTGRNPYALPAKDSAKPEAEAASAPSTSTEVTPRKKGADDDDDDEWPEAWKPEQLPATIAIADTYNSQGAYALASACEEVYVQPSGSVPLTGISAQIPFFKRLADKLGVDVHAEARRDWKSMIATFTQEDGLTDPQLQNEAELLGSLNTSLCYAIGVSRFPDMDPNEAADRVMELAQKGPYPANEAEELGLCKVAYPYDVVKRLGKKRHYKTVPHYSRIFDGMTKKLSEDERAEIAVVYLLGSISSAPGEFGAGSAIKGLKQAAADDKIKTIVFRIDSGGGDTVASDSLWAAVKRAKEAGKIVVTSIGNSCASGGVFASCASDAILASETSICGSIGVASLRPTLAAESVRRLGLGVQTIGTGSLENSLLHPIEDLKRHSKHIDEIYEIFLEKVCTGRGIPRDRIEELAGGRVFTGLTAWAKCSPEHKVQLDAGGVPGAEDSRIVPAASLVSTWRTEDITKPGRLSTIKVVRDDSAGENKAAQQVDAVPSSPEDKDAVELAALASEVASSEGDGVEAPAKKEGKIMVRSVNESAEEKFSSEDEAELAALAAAAHEEAEASQKDRKEEGKATLAAIKQQEAPKGPYGRGIIDSIGGIYEAAVLGMTMSINAELERLVTEEGMTLEQAQAKIKPGARRETDQDGTQTIVTDIQLVRYPRAPSSFLARVRELNRRSDEPSLSILPSLSALQTEIVSATQRAAVRALLALVRDPETVQRTLASMASSNQYHSIVAQRETHVQV